MNLTGISQSAIEKAIREAGLAMASDQVREIIEAERECLTACGRVSFGVSAAVRIVHAFAASPYLVGDDAAHMLAELIEAFYELRADFPAVVTDTEIIESLEEAFNGDAGGDTGFTAALASTLLAKRSDYMIYEIADDDGKVYRWDPDEWRDDLLADGWYGERWEDADE